MTPNKELGVVLEICRTWIFCISIFNLNYEDSPTLLPLNQRDGKAWRKGKGGGGASYNASYISARLGTISFWKVLVCPSQEEDNNQEQEILKIYFKSYKSISEPQTREKGFIWNKSHRAEPSIDWAQDPCQPSEQEMREASPLRRHADTNLPSRKGNFRHHP